MKKTALLLTFLAGAGLAKAQCNLVTNGDFSGGSAGFSSGYTMSCDATVNPSPIGSLDMAGAYCVSMNMADHHAYFTNCSYQGNMLVANGGTNASVAVWSQTVTVMPNTTYTFRVDAASASPSNPAQLVLAVNGTNSSATTLDSLACSWQTLSYTWNSGSSTTATLSIYDLNTAASGNDFALDNISLSTAPMIAAGGTSVMNTVCGRSTGSITVTASGSSGPYMYSLGGAYQSSNVFTGLYAGTYLVRVSNACGDVSAPVAVTVGTLAPTLTVTGTMDASYCVCPAVTTGTVTIATSATAPLSYSINNGAWTGFTGSPYTIMNLAPNTSYSIRVMDSCGNVSNSVSAYIAKKLKVMHYTGSKKNPSNVICIDESAVAAHMANHTNPNNPSQHDYVIEPCNTARMLSGTAAGTETDEIRVVPNPNNGVFQVMLPQLDADAQLLVTDVQGRIVHREVVTAGSPVADVNLSTLGKGIYFVSLTGDKAYKSRIVIE